MRTGFLSSRALSYRLFAIGIFAIAVVIYGPAKAQFSSGTYVDGKPVFSSDRVRRVRRPAARRNRTVRAHRRRAGRIRSQRLRRSRRNTARALKRGNVRLRQERNRKPRLTGKKPPVPQQNARRPKKFGPPVLHAVVSLKSQRMTIYKDERAMTVTRVSTGKAGHATPTGIFSIFQKRRFHRSNIYSGAPMPFMQRITWSGIALHMGRVPGYPASHGCVRLPASFAAKFFRMTPMRMHVVVADGNHVPKVMSHPNLPGFPQARQPATDKTVQHEPLAAGPRARLTQGVPSALIRANYNAGGQASEQQTLLPRQQAIWSRTSEVFVRHDLEPSQAKRGGAPLRILVTRRSIRDRVVGTQRRLLLLGYKAGEVDGQLGPQTVAAIRMFQGDQGLTVTGLGNDETRLKLAEMTDLPWSAAIKVYVRQNGEQIYSGPVSLANADRPLGTHFYTFLGQYEGDAKAVWSTLTLQGKGRLPNWSQRLWRTKLDEIEPMTARQAIERVRFPPHVRAMIEQRLTNGSSLILADRGSTRETGIGTDFIVLTDR